MEGGPLCPSFYLFYSKPSLCPSCLLTDLLQAMKPLPDDTKIHDPANEPPPFRRRLGSSSHQTSPEPPCLTSPDSFPPPVPAEGSSNRPALAPTFSPPTTCSKSTAKHPLSSPRSQPNPASKRSFL